MQPYFLPYIGYWQLMASVDTFILFDVVQYNKRSWMNRNRILHSDVNKSFQYVSLPVKKPKRGELIQDILIADNDDWRASIAGSLSVYQRMRAQEYRGVSCLVQDIFSIKEANFSRFIGLHMEKVLAYLAIDKKIVFASDIDFDRSEIEGPGDWALSICKAYGADEYVNPHGGADIFDEGKYCDSGVDIKFLKPKLTPYKQGRREGFEPGLSILDVLMFADKQSARKALLEDFDVCSKTQLGES